MQQKGTEAPLDLRKQRPRSGRTTLGPYAWLGRLIDKARAEHAGTQGDYMAYCAVSTGFLEHVGIAKDDFDQLIRSGASDEQILEYFEQRVPDEKRAEANRFVFERHKDDLDQQDKEEGYG